MRILGDCFVNMRHSLVLIVLISFKKTLDWRYFSIVSQFVIHFSCAFSTSVRVHFSFSISAIVMQWSANFSYPTVTYKWIHIYYFSYPEEKLKQINQENELELIA